VLIALRTVTTYAAAAALLIVAARRLLAPVRLRAALLLGAAPLLFTGHAMVTGGVYAPVDILYNTQPFGAHRAELGIPPDRTPLLVDVATQMLPWAAAVRRDLFEGRAPLWNPYSLAGEPLLGVQQAGALHPIAIASLALPFPQAVTFAAALRILAALLFAYLYLREICCGEAAALLGALGWAFGDWMTFYLGYPEHPAAAALPLLLLGLRRITRDPGPRPAAIAAVALFFAAASGHPETLLHVAAVGGAYFVFELYRTPAGRRTRPVLTAVAAGAFAAGLAAIVLLPFLELLPHTFEHALRRSWYAHKPRALPVAGLARRLAPHAVPIAAGASGHGAMAADSGLPAAYGGAILLPLAFTGLFARRRERWFFAAVGVLALAVAAGTPAADLLAKIPGFDIAINERLTFVAAFSLCVLAAFGADRLTAGEGAPAFLASSAASLALVAWIASRNGATWSALATPPQYVRERLLLELAPLALGILLFASLPRRLRPVAPAALAGILAVSRTLEAAQTYPTLPASAFYPAFGILDRIPRGEPYRVAGIGNALVPNVSAVYGIEDVRAYEAMTLSRLRDTFPLCCVPQGVWFNRVDDATRPFLSFLNVRWLLTELPVPAPEGWRVVAEQDGLRLFENARPIPRAFAPQRVRRVADPALAMEALRGISNFAERGVVEEATAADWSENGPATVTIASYTRVGMELGIEAAAETVIATSIPASPGWRADMDGRRLPLVVYNHAFVAFRVSPGRHRVRVRYAPDSFRAGAAISLATLVACSVIAWRSRSQ